MRKHNTKEAGFTLLELLTVLGTLSILLSISARSYNLYKLDAYNSVTEQMMNVTKTALEAGKIENDFMEDWGFVWIGLTSPGLTTGDAGNLLPGLVNPDDFELYVSHDAWCETGLMGEWCTTDWIDARHCNGDQWYSWSRMRNGIEWSFQWETIPGSC